MTFQYASDREPSRSSAIETDLCIVGAGAAGMAVALELEGGPLRVCLLESGGAHGGEEAGEVEVVGRPLHADWALRNRGFGGTTATWFGRCARFDAEDFAPRAWVPESGWPIAPAEVDRHLAAAARVLGLGTIEDLDPARIEPRDPLERALTGSGLSRRVHRVLARPRLGDTHRAALARSKNVTVLLDATATRLRAGESGSFVSVLEARTASGRALEVRAKHYVLAGGGIENARLLLLSRRGESAALGNDHDQVGRWYLNHPRADGVGRWWLDRSRPAHARIASSLLLGRARGGGGGVQLALAADRAWLAARCLTGISTFCYAVDPELLGLRQALDCVRADLARRRASRRSFESALRLVARAPLLAKVAAERALRRAPRFEHLALVDQVEQAPDPESRVTLAERCDDLGLPLARLDWRYGSEVVATHRAFHRELAAWIERAGLGRLESALLEGDACEPAYTDSSHPMGTTRMHADARHGVVDVDARVHGVENLWIAGSSIFPTGGHAAPTLTLVALAIRLARRLMPAM